MKEMFRSLSVCFAAGVAGGLANAIFVWAAGAFGLTALLGVAIAPAWTAPWLYQRLVWGGIWGFLFLLPVLDRRMVLRGLLYGLPPSAVQLAVIFPNVLGKGMWGLDLGALTPVVVLVANTVWGLAASWWVRRNQGASRARGYFG